MMLLAPLSQVELRAVSSGASQGAVPAASFVTFSQSYAAVPNNEQWIVMSLGGRIVFDDPQLVGIGCAASVTVGGVVQFVPGQVTRLEGVSTLVGAVSLSGMELPPGTVVAMFIDVQNTDAVAAHNITQGIGGMIVRPLRLVSEIAVANVVQERVDRNLNERLMRTRG